MTTNISKDEASVVQTESIRFRLFGWTSIPPAILEPACRMFFFVWGSSGS